jgi:hypothetical protein
MVREHGALRNQKNYQQYANICRINLEDILDVDNGRASKT